MKKRSHLFTSPVVFFLIFYCVIFINCTTMPDPLSKRALDELFVTLRTQPEFIKVHAAEYLIWLGHKEEAREAFLAEDKLHGDQPKYRIGIWRVLAQTEQDSSGAKTWQDKIYRAFGDLEGPDRLHASETLAKLQLSPLEKYPEATQQSLSSENKNLKVYTLWAISFASQDSLTKNRVTFINKALKDTTTDVRKISSYILRRMGLTGAQWTDFAEQSLAEPDSSELKLSLLTTAFITQPNDGVQDLKSRLKTKLLSGAEERSYAGQIEISMALAEHGQADDLRLLTALLDKNKITGAADPDDKEKADVRAAASYAILKITQNRK
jgi:hypothetical protein